MALLFTFFSLLLLFFLILLDIIPSNFGYSILMGIATATLNFLLFLAGYAYSIKKSNKTFLLFTIGGIGVRLLIILSLVVLSIKLLKVELLGFIFALFIWYVFYQIVEIIIVRQGLGKR
ncbi:MAG: hypothetical protein CVV24_12675 [Ignavibacteriae bacterium HGW-Ignavibacteriae-3]|nr:MAG: hypothetical protein CVV24_12675 [Ignavibacteriae bacterium HGW-Ignavibacteriae-3]